MDKVAYLLYLKSKTTTKFILLRLKYKPIIDYLHSMDTIEGQSFKM